MTRASVLVDMEIFVEVAKHRSFSRAAVEIGIPISSLSRRLKRLEESIGVRLMDRTTRRITLTSYGEAFYAQAVRVVEEAQRAYDDVAADARGLRGLLKIVAHPNAWLLNSFASFISEYRSTNDLVEIQLDLSHGPIDLMGDRYDLAVMLEPPKESALVVRKMRDVENGIFAAPGYLEDWGRPHTPSDLADHHVIVSGQGSTWSLSREGETVSVAVAGPVSSNSPTLTHRLAVEGHGLFASDILQVREDVESGALVQVMPAWKLETTSLCIVTTSRLLSARARSFIDFVLSQEIHPQAA
jgi:DNA-binding transcriptional LysR family regulator